MRSPLRAVAICSAALFVPLLIPLVTGRVFTLDDLAAFHIPFRHLYSEALHRGDSILWTPAVYSGYYQFGEGQVGMAHPWHLLLYRVFPLSMAFNLEIIGSYLAMFAGMVLLFRRIGLSREARWFGAMVFTFSGYNLFHVIHPNIIAVAAHIPWLLLVTHAIVTAVDRKTSVRAVVALALLFASQLLLGHPQQVWLGLIAVGCEALCLSWGNVVRSRLALVAGGLAVGALIAGVQLVPLIDVAEGSERTTWSLANSLSHSLVPTNLVQLWAPFFFATRVDTIRSERTVIHEFIVYNGAFCTLALAWIALRWDSLRRKRLVIALLLFTSLALLLALGRYGGVYAGLALLPGLRWFRVPARHLFLFQLGLSTLAALAFEDLVEIAGRSERIDLRRLWPIAMLVALSVTTTALGAVLVHLMPAASWVQRLSGLRAAAPWSAVFVLMALLLVFAARGARWAVPVLVAVVALDQGCWGFQYVWGDPLRPVQTIEALTARTSVPDGAQPGDLFQVRNLNKLQNLPVLQGFRVWTGYVGLPPALKLPTGSPNLLTARIGGAKWWLSGTLEYETIQAAAGRARLLARTNVSTNVAADARTIDILQEALVDDPIDGLIGPPGSARVVEDRPGRIVVETTAPSRQLLVLTERFHPGWRVTDSAGEPNHVDRRRAGRTMRVYGDFLGYVVDAGTHRLTFVFAPTSFREGLWISGLLIVVLWAI
jgi:hypothetical protein